MSPRLKEQYVAELRAALQEDLGLIGSNLREV